MKNLYHRLLLVIAGATQEELATQVRYLKTENQVLRSKLPKRVAVNEKERTKLIKFSSQLGGVLKHYYRKAAYLGPWLLYSIVKDRSAVGVRADVVLSHLSPARCHVVAVQSAE
jgi:hypothetical protein